MKDTEGTKFILKLETHFLIYWYSIYLSKFKHFTFLLSTEKKLMYSLHKSWRFIIFQIIHILQNRGFTFGVLHWICEGVRKVRLFLYFLDFVHWMGKEIKITWNTLQRQQRFIFCRKAKYKFGADKWYLYIVKRKEGKPWRVKFSIDLKKLGIQQINCIW